MPKKKKGNRRNAGNKEQSKRELIFKEDGQEYAQIVRLLGNCRAETLCMDGKTRLGTICGRMRKKRIWVNNSDFVLVGLRDFQDDKCDIIVKYTVDEARTLKAYGELPKEIKINEDSDFNEEDTSCPFEFTSEFDDEDEEETEINAIDLDEI